MNKIIILLMLSLSFLFSNTYLEERNALKLVAEYTKNIDFINEVKAYKEGQLNITGKTKNREYITYLYKKYPQYQKLIYTNFDTNSNDVYPFSIKEDDIKINQSKYIITKNKKDVFFSLLTRYFFTILFILMIILTISFAFLNKNKFYIIKIIISILTIVSIAIYYFLYDSVFHNFNYTVIHNLHNIILIFGIVFTVLFSLFYNKNSFLLGGVIISFVSYFIISLLSFIFI